MSPTRMDELDHKILEALQSDGRRSIRDMAMQLDVPETTVRDHIHRMEESGVVLSHRPILNHTALGITESAWLFARCDEADRARIAETLGKHQQVVAVRLFATDLEHFALRIMGSKQQSIAQVIESALMDMDFRIKSVVPINTTPQPNPSDETFWPGEQPALFGAQLAQTTT